MSLYQEIILDHYRAPRNFKPLKNPTNSVIVNNPLCGDKFKLDIVLKKDKVVKLGYSGEGCAISVASASLLSEYALGKNKKDLLKLDKNFIIRLLGIELSPNRIKCALLSWEALLKVLK